MGSQCQVPTQVLAEGSGLLGHFSPPTAFCASPLGPSSGAVPILVCWDTAGVSLCPAQSSDMGLVWCCWGIEGSWGLLGSPSLAQPLWDHGFGCHWAAFGGNPFSSVPRKEMLRAFVASPAPCQCHIHLQMVSPEPTDGLKNKK